MRATKVPADILLTDNFVGALNHYRKAVCGYIDKVNVPIETRSGTFKSALADLNKASRLLRRVQLKKTEREGAMGRIDRALNLHGKALAHLSDRIPDEVVKRVNENTLKHFARVRRDLACS